jgi:hypothetical protein
VDNRESDPIPGRLESILIPEVVVALPKVKEVVDTLARLNQFKSDPEEVSALDEMAPEKLSVVAM